MNRFLRVSLTFGMKCGIMDGMDIKTWLDEAKTRIDALDAELIAVYNFAPNGRDRSWLMAHLDEQIPLRNKCDATDMVAKRQRGVPLAYILGEKEFYGRLFTVSPAVLIPRPETEDLINLIKELDLPERAKFLEIGTGSGCIGVTLALEYPQSYVLATDISVRALDMAARNNLRHEGRIELVQSNLLKEVDFEKNEDGSPEYFCVVVANLPYVNKEWDWLNLPTLEFEPSSALYARGSNGLSMYQRFIKELWHYYNIGEVIFDYVVLEADPCQHAELIKMAERYRLFYVKALGYGLLFEAGWHYWYDYRVKGYVRKPEEVIKKELARNEFSYVPDEEDF